MAVFGDYESVGPNFHLEKWIGMVGLSRNGVDLRTIILLEKMKINNWILGFSNILGTKSSDCAGIARTAHLQSPFLQEDTSIEGKWSLEERLGKFEIGVTRGIG